MRGHRREEPTRGRVRQPTPQVLLEADLSNGLRLVVELLARIEQLEARLDALERAA